MAAYAAGSLTPYSRADVPSLAADTQCARALRQYPASCPAASVGLHVRCSRERAVRRVARPV